MERWKIVVVMGTPGTPQLGADLERAGHQGYEPVGVAPVYGNQIAIVLKKRITLESATADYEALEDQADQHDQCRLVGHRAIPTGS
jgi:hypothetical protein